jgi:hypothetical protein
MATLSPADALSSEGFYSLYLGGLAIESEQRRREACYVLLGMGRLGLRVEELTHLHDGWVDWARGEVQVPARDPCACRACWARAQARREAGDDRPVEEIVAADMWAPPAGDRGARTLAFGWSRRISAALDGVLAADGYLDADREEIQALVTEAAENAWEVEKGEVTLATLRATAGTFLATAGFGPRRLADLLAIDEETAGAFARVGGGEVRDHLYRALRTEPAPTICEEDSAYRLVCDPTPFDREPFDPTGYNARWRTDRAEQTSQRGRNPRKAAVPEDSTFDPLEEQELREPTADSGPQLVNDTLSDWVARRESQREQYARTGSPTGDGDAADYRDQVTAPVQFSLGTRFAGQDIESGRPAGGTVALGQRELVFVSRDETGVSDTLRVPLSAVVDVAPGYVPGPLEGIFDETVGIAYHDDHDERRIVVCELPPELSWEFQQAVFASLLTEVETVVADFSQEHADPGDVEPERRLLTATSRTLKLDNPDDPHDLALRIRLATIVDVEETTMQSEVGYEMGLLVHHLQVNANVAAMELRPTDDDAATILKRYLETDHDRRLEKARNTSLTDEQLEVLDALHDAGEGRDLVAILDMNPSRVASVVESLDELGLVRDSRTGLSLTGTGYLVTREGSVLYDSSEGGVEFDTPE